MRRARVPKRMGRAVCLAVTAVGGTLMGATPVSANASAATDVQKFADELATSAHAVDQLRAGPALMTGQQRGVRAVTSTGVLYDAIGDNQLLAPDLQRMLAFTGDDGRYTVGITLGTNSLIPGDFVASYVNVDGNAATGNPTFGGADLSVGILGQYGSDVVGTQVWTGADWQLVSFPSLISFASGTTDQVWSIAAGELGLTPGAPTSMQFATLYSGTYDSYFDFAPEPGGAPLALTVGSLAPPPPPPAPAPAPTSPAPGSPAPTGVTTGGQTTPSPVAVRSLDLRSTPRGLRMRLGWVQGRGRIYWDLRLRARINGRVVTKEAFGSGRAGTRNVQRVIRLPATWKGRRISVRLRVDDDRRTVTRSRTVVY